MADGNNTATRYVDNKQIAIALNVTKRAVELRCAKEDWPFRPRAGRGGGREYCTATLPVDVREALERHVALQAAASIEKSPEFQAGKAAARRANLADTINAAVQRRTTETGAAAAAALTGAARARMEARLDLLTRLETYRTQRRVGVCQALDEFCLAYSRRDLHVPDDVRAVIGPELAPISLRRWRETLANEGAAALGGKYGNRTGSGTIETNQAVRDFAVGLIADKPHITAATLALALDARFGPQGVALPSARGIQRFLQRWKSENAEAFQALTNPDAWKNHRMVAFGNLDEGIVRANQLWMFDSTPGDVQLLDGRYNILGSVDVARRQAGFHLSKTSSAEAVCQLLRRQILEWGVPEAIKMDNGRDYTSTRVSNALVALGVEPRFSAPFSPWEKANVERLFRTLSHGLMELLPGYIGHNVNDQQAIRARDSFADRLFKKNAVTEIRLTAAEFQDFLDRWARDFYQHQPHEGLGGQTPFERSAQLRGTIRSIGDVRALDLMLSDGGVRVVGKKGIKLERLTYIAPELALLVREPVRILKDEDDLGRIVVYHNDAFVCVAECPEVLGVSRREIAAEAKARQTKAVQEKKRELKALGRKANVRDIAFEILDRKAQQNAALETLPAPNVVHLTPALEAASVAAAALDAEPAEPRAVTQLADVADTTRVLRDELRQDETAETRFRAAMEILLIPDAERDDIQRMKLKRALDTSEFKSRWMVFEDFGPAQFGLSDDFLALMPQGALYFRFREAQLIPGE